MDLFVELRKLSTAKKVSNIRTEVANRALNFIFFLCPKISGYRLNKAKTGLTTTFQEGVRDSTLERIALVQRFQGKQKQTPQASSTAFQKQNANYLIFQEKTEVQSV